MVNLYYCFIYWMNCLPMEEVFFFTYIFIIVAALGIGIPLGLYLERNTTPCNISKN